MLKGVKQMAGTNVSDIDAFFSHIEHKTSSSWQIGLDILIQSY